MKTKFSSLDVACAVKELQTELQGIRVVNVYNINNKSYIIKMGQEEKKMLYIESGSRIHLTEFEWPKQMMPSVFSAKCRKVMKNKRLTSITQLGSDRIVDLQFGSEEFSSHLIVELYDRGNVCLCDHQYVITAILRTRQDEKEDIRYAVSHFYPMDSCQKLCAPLLDDIKKNMNGIKPNTLLKRWLSFLLPFSLPLIEHCLYSKNLLPNTKVTDEFLRENIDQLHETTVCAYELYQSIPETIVGIHVFKDLKKDVVASVMDEFHPFMFHQFLHRDVRHFKSFNQCIDHFFYEQNSQKIELKSAQQEKSMLKKLENIKKDHEKRISDLKTVQEESKRKGYLVEVNIELVDEAIDIIQNAIANRLTWDEINELIEEGQENGHKTALAIKSANLQKNVIILALDDPYTDEETLTDVIVDLDLGAYGNAKKYYDEVRVSVVKEQKTIQSSSVALKNAEKKTKAKINDLNIVTSIKKARKLMWFERFLWFLSSERYIVIGGRDAQQNEILVRRYLKKNDIYVHADTHGATSIIVKNRSADPIPPKTIMEAGCFALCHSSAWENKIVTSAYWVYAQQVSKTAPSGEYLTTGSFMIRGKKNYLPPSQHVLGFSVLFKIDDESIERRHSQSKEADVVVSTEVPVAFPEEMMEEVKGDEVLNVNNKVEDIGDLFDKYNLQISVISSSQSPANSSNTEFTEFIGTAHKPNYKKIKPINQKNPQPQNTQPEKKTQDNNQPKRGQRGKNKKRQKYADQSDDEREAAMALLGSVPTSQKQEKIKHSNSKRKYKQQSTAKNVACVDTIKKASECKQILVTADSQSNINTKNTEEIASEIRTDKEITTEPNAISREVPSTQEIAVEDEEDNEKDEPIDFLDSLIVDPAAEDSVIFGIPLVAPYTVMSACKYKCKLTPGTTKKGRACKTILDMFSRDKAATLQEKNVFKSLKDVDLTINIPGKVKISAPNLYKRK